MHVLQELLVILAVAVVVVMALKKIGLPPIAGLIVAGVLLGPGVLGLVGDAQQVEVLAERGACIDVLLRDGTSMRVPRSWTDADGSPVIERPGRDAVFTVGAFRELIGLIRALRGRT